MVEFAVPNDRLGEHVSKVADKTVCEEIVAALECGDYERVLTENDALP